MSAAAIVGASSGSSSSSTATAVRRTVGSRIVATGCTGGIGLHFIRQLLLSPPNPHLPPPYHILLLARKPNAPHIVRARQELEAMSASSGDGGKGGTGETFVEVREMDLALLRSVRRGAKSLLSDLSHRKADLSSSSSSGSGSGSGSSTSTTASASAGAGASARAFERIAPGRIDVLLLNAAVAKAKREFVVDEDAITATAGERQKGDKLSDAEGRYEESACVNHVSQQLLVALLAPALLGSRSSSADAQQTQGESVSPVPRIVFTSSALHRQIKDVKHLDAFFNPGPTTASSSDPSSDSSAPPPAWSLMGSYGASKFLQMLGVQRLLKELQSLPLPRGFTSAQIDSSSSSSSSSPRIEVIAVQPGFIPSTGLSRETSPLARIATLWILPFLAPLVSFIATPEEGGEMLLRACTRPVDEISAGVRKTLLVRGRAREGGQRAERQRPDVRSEDEGLMEEWWPDVVRREWERQVTMMKGQGEE
ncbi:hypothetical protein BCV69DRAFT_52908 [Microstroma glucosiphilum]|uniref:NAD(P)-binding protein n=1 Tax=Pseudomicrostroma glucosiphilum TaxID=1684307 RepID=A0A316U263_9BASI|nr:hypothetical protein BCV69DRAFT_52908 [Pseudomicrostroma glucosiphilum]PWN18904.1 hypothetical protein BCV69DRAFT_52908 [Pseudomicrostroma glucosiphilum]